MRQSLGSRAALRQRNSKVEMGERVLGSDGNGVPKKSFTISPETDLSFSHSGCGGHEHARGSNPSRPSQLKSLDETARRPNHRNKWADRWPVHVSVRHRLRSDLEEANYGEQTDY